VILPIPTKIHTSRLALRRQHPDDAGMIKEAVDTSLSHLQSSVAWAFSILDLQETRVLGGAGLERAEDALIALVGPGAVETGYWMRADATGHGFATEATACLARLAFTHLGAERVVVCHDPANGASEGVPRRLGFRSFGTVAHELLPGRLAANGSVRPATKVWVLDASDRVASAIPATRDT
jgi:ribosomal-protein-serine acetyltransferase